MELSLKPISTENKMRPFLIAIVVFFTGLNGCSRTDSTPPSELRASDVQGDPALSETADNLHENDSLNKTDLDELFEPSNIPPRARKLDSIPTNESPFQRKRRIAVEKVEAEMDVHTYRIQQRIRELEPIRDHYTQNVQRLQSTQRRRGPGYSNSIGMSGELAALSAVESDIADLEKRLANQEKEKELMIIAETWNLLSPMERDEAVRNGDVSQKQKELFEFAGLGGK